jgi:hypothetical protein
MDPRIAEDLFNEAAPAFSMAIDHAATAAIALARRKHGVDLSPREVGELMEHAFEFALLHCEFTQGR